VPQILDLEHAQIGRHLVAGMQEDHIAGHNILHLYSHLVAVTQHYGLVRQYTPDGLNRFFSLALLDKTDHGIDEHYAKDDAGIDPVRH
jgi:hypothetical protein